MPTSTIKKNNQDSGLSEIKKLVQENIELTKQLEVKIQKINRYIVWQRIFFVVKILVIAVPIILSIIYLPTILQNTLAPYQELLQNSQQLYGF